MLVTAMRALTGARVHDAVGALFLAFLINATMLWAPCSPVYVYNTQVRQQGMLKWLCRELLLDADSKVKAVQRYRDQYYKSLQYQLADMLYEMRDFFKKIVTLYQGADKNISYGYLDQNRNVIDLVRVQRMGMEIENKVAMVQTWQRKRESKPQHHARMQAALRSAARQHDDELHDVPLRELPVRQRMARGGYSDGGAPHRAPLRAPALDLGDKRKNKKWRHVRDDHFARRSV